jgi:hypothetical protein
MCPRSTSNSPQSVHVFTIKKRFISCWNYQEIHDNGPNQTEEKPTTNHSSPQRPKFAFSHNQLVRPPLLTRASQEKHPQKIIIQRQSEKPIKNPP